MTDDFEPFAYLCGCPSRMGEDFAGNKTAIDAVFEAQRGLWNDLATIEAGHRDAWREAISAASEEVRARSSTECSSIDAMSPTHPGIAAPSRN